jgi:hypothetical protein
LAAIASLSSGRPPAGEYLWFFGSRQAAAAASTTWAGVGKSGSPAPKPITDSPAALSAFARASTARVADSVMAPTRAEMRCSLMPETVGGDARRTKACSPDTPGPAVEIRR